MSQMHDQVIQELDFLEMMDLLPVGVCVITENLEVRAWNQLLGRWTDISPAEALGMNLAERYPNLAEPRYRERLEQVFSAGTPAVYTAALHKHFIPIPLARGQSEELMVQQTQVRLLTGEQRLAMIAIQDVTAQCRQLTELRRERSALVTAKSESEERFEEAQQMRSVLLSMMEDAEASSQRLKALHKKNREMITMLRSSELRTRSIVESAIDGIITIDEEGIVQSLNPAAERIFGYAIGEVVGRNVQMLMPDPYKREHDEYIKRYLRTGEARVIGIGREATGCRKDGTLFPLDFTIGEAIIDDKRVFTGIIRDITDRKQSEEAMANLAAIVESSNDAVISLVLAGVISSWNVGAEKAYGYTASEAIGMAYEKLLLPQRSHEMKDVLGRIQKGEAVDRFDTIRVRKDGNLRNVAQTVSAIRDKDGHITGASSIESDVTARCKAEQAVKDYAEAMESTNLALQEANTAAEAATQAKSIFLANMSHEIRTPMTAILGYADLIHKAIPDHPEVQRDVDIVRTNGRYLIELINDILDLSKIEAGKMEMEVIECCPMQIVAEVAATMNVVAVEKGLHLQVRYRGAIPRYIRTDPTRLRQSLINLTSNAVKFTEHGKVSLSIGLVGTKTEPRMEFSVLDTGIGIPEDKLKTIFEPFSQADDSTTRKFGGTGLGLTITKQIAEALGGTLEVASELGVGAVFSMIIGTGSLDGVELVSDPSEVVQSIRQDGRAARAAQFRGHVLLAEDVPVNRRLVTTILEDMGVSVEIAENGEQAVERVEEHQFDLILMDIQMPIMDGLSATRELRERGIDIPIVALTANVMRGDREACFAAGCSGYLAKPIDTQALCEELAKHLDVVELPGDQPAVAGKPTSREDPPSLATVDPNRQPVEPERAMAQLQISMESYLEALKETVPWLREQQETLLAVVGQDDGAAAHAIKSASGNLGMPYVFAAARNLEMAAKGNQETDLAQLTQDLNAHITEALDHVERILHGAGDASSAGGGADSSRYAGAINEELAIRRMGLKRDDYLMILRESIEYLKDMRGRLHEIPTECPSAAMSDMVHAIASNSGNMGMERVFKAAKRVELMADGELEGDAAVAVSCLFTELDRAFEHGAALLGDEGIVEESPPPAPAEPVQPAARAVQPAVRAVDSA